MGANFARAIADITESEFSLEQQLTWHLTGNFYPPIPASMVQPCVEAINAYWNDDIYAEINLPEGITYKNGLTTAPAYAIVDQHRLDEWCSAYDYDAWNDYGMEG